MHKQHAIVPCTAAELAEIEGGNILAGLTLLLIACGMRDQEQLRAGINDGFC